MNSGKKKKNRATYKKTKLEFCLTSSYVRCIIRITPAPFLSGFGLALGTRPGHTPISNCLPNHKALPMCPPRRLPLLLPFPGDYSIVFGLSHTLPVSVRLPRCTISEAPGKTKTFPTKKNYQTTDMRGSDPSTSCRFWLCLTRGSSRHHSKFPHMRNTCFSF